MATMYSATRPLMLVLHDSKQEQQIIMWCPAACGDGSVCWVPSAAYRAIGGHVQLRQPKHATWQRLRDIAVAIFLTHTPQSCSAQPMP